MSSITNKALTFMADIAEDAFLEALGLASTSGAYEPEMSDEVKAYKANHVSKMESLFNKLEKKF